MAERVKFFAIVLAMQSFTFGLLAAELPQHDAPFGLRFGMSAQDVHLPVSPPPNVPKPQPLPRYYNTNPSSPTIYEIPYNEKKIYEELLDARTSLLSACARSFDYPFSANYNDMSWASWIRSITDYAEIHDLTPDDILSGEKLITYNKHKEIIKKREITKPTGFRSLSIHTVMHEGVNNDLCLIFTDDGLSHIYASHNIIDSVAKEVYQRLDADTRYEQYHSKRKSKFWLFDPGHAIHVVNILRVYVDKKRKIMISGKNSKPVGDIIEHIIAWFMIDDFDDGLGYYISFTDLLRRGRTFERYKEKTLPILSAAIRDAFEADEAAKIRNDEIKGDKRYRDSSDRKKLIESFR
jgi:hypothetical protein